MKDRRAASASNPTEADPFPNRRALGDAGEAYAARHLEQVGYRILERNVRAGGVEIDLIAEHRGTIAIIEVKSRRNRAFGAPETAVDMRKQRRLRHGAMAWLHDYRGRVRSVRFDVIACEWSSTDGWRLRHLQSAFEATTP